jgi:hypothetical protein
MNLGGFQSLRHLSMGRIDLSIANPTHWESLFIAQLGSKLEEIRLEYVGRGDYDVRYYDWSRLQDALAFENQERLRSISIEIKGQLTDAHACKVAIAHALPLLDGRGILRVSSQSIF